MTQIKTSDIVKYAFIFSLTGLVIGFGIFYLHESFDSNPNQLNIWSILILIYDAIICIIYFTNVKYLEEHDKAHDLCNIKESVKNTTFLHIVQYCLTITMFIWGVCIFAVYKSSDVYPEMWIWFQVLLWASLINLPIILLKIIYLLVKRVNSDNSSAV